MTAQTQPRIATMQPQLVTGWRKFVGDIGAVFEMRLMLVMRNWYWYVMGTLVFPLGMFYFANALAPDDPSSVRRAMGWLDHIRIGTP